MYLLFLKRRVGFIELTKLLGLTPGNLEHHIRKLQETGLVEIHRIITWKPLVVVEITDLGKNTFRGYIFKLKKLLKDIPERLLKE